MCIVPGLTAVSTILDVEKIIETENSLHLKRQSLKIDVKSKSLNNNVTLESAGIESRQQAILEDLGPQIGWEIILFVECAGPLIVYLLK